MAITEASRYESDLKKLKNGEAVKLMSAEYASKYKIDGFCPLCGTRMYAVVSPNGLYCFRRYRESPIHQSLCGVRGKDESIQYKMGKLSKGEDYFAGIFKKVGGGDKKGGGGTGKTKKGNPNGKEVETVQVTTVKQIIRSSEMLLRGKNAEIADNGDTFADIIIPGAWAKSLLPDFKGGLKAIECYFSTKQKLEYYNKLQFYCVVGKGIERKYWNFTAHIPDKELFQKTKNKLFMRIENSDNLMVDVPKYMTIYLIGEFIKNEKYSRGNSLSFDINIESLKQIDYSTSKRNNVKEKKSNDS